MGEATAESDAPDPYFYDDGAASHPVIEYKPDRAEKSGGSAIPSFVLDVTWPRVAVFYHPSSPLCRSFRDKYVALARATRHRSNRVPASFHAVSCLVHDDVCEEYGIKAVPVVMAFDSGRIDPVIVKRTADNSIDPEQLAHVLGIELEEEEEEDGHAAETDAEEAPEKSAVHPPANLLAVSSGVDRNRNVAAAAALANAMLHSSHSEVYSDGSGAFMASLEYGTYDEFAKGKPLPAERADALREFLDLLHWTLPSQWKLHDVINDLRADFDSVSRSHEDLLSVLYRHKNPNDRWVWSESCDRFDRGDIDGGLDRQEGLQGYTCGLWRLLHISTIGVAEQHMSVMGDRERVRPSRAVAAIRDYVENYYVGSCMRCGRALIESVDECRFDLCGGRAAAVTADTLSTDPGWRDLAVWLWRVHNEVRQKGFGGEPWPLRDQCGDCRKTVEWDMDAVYAHLKHRYWPLGVQNPRIVVLNGRSKRGRFARFRGRTGSWSLASLLFVLLGVGVIGWLSWLRFQVHRSGLHKKTRHWESREGGSEKRPRRLRHRSGGSRTKSRNGQYSQLSAFLDE